MLYFTTELKTYHIYASDGEMGKIRDLYFDDTQWAIRYAVVDTRKWLPGRRVLLSPTAFINLNESNENLEVKYDKEAIRNSPAIPEENPISKDVEDSLIDYYGWSRYWIGNALWGPEYGPLSTSKGEEPTKEQMKYDQQMNGQDYDLRSENETINYKVHADNGKVGRVADMIYDDEQWKIQYIVVQSNESMVEEEYIVYTPGDIQSVDWFEEDIYVKGSLEEMKQSKLYKSKEEILSDL
ncbi:sporulation protein YlmC with PRC-barrel domain [Virgibacillus natechei]|uniref:Sporulation protein YlmC with PRC-barrel domain n=1 Tax=Virgibacillus natechei TaxID=1216297 RepID=A0ABS4II82_9BACI|nr:PRC-barrel domain-containing protein [Virgibacillus natechei]MBP1970151.1 sporulation protein YlmC with PRC-barrel domain [Virgibacillus natechei]UZD14222.1 PRC-barrel domain-containing protein [Virgibacillus natechei]